MELRHFRYFVALAEQLSFTNAAEKVHVTQSTLSHQIKQLEDEVGMRLFERVGKQVRITEAGEIFLARVKNALREVEDGLWALKQKVDAFSGELRIGTTYTFNMRIVPRCVSMYIEQHPSVRVSVYELSGDEIAGRLARGDLDLGIAYEETKSEALRFEPLYNEEMVLVVRPEHHLAKRKWLRMVDLHRQKLVLLPQTFATRHLLDKCFQLANAEPIVIAEMNTIAPMIELVCATDVAAIISEHAVPQANVHIIPLESPTPVRTPGLLWPQEHARNPVASHFASLIRDIAEQADPRRSKGRRKPLKATTARRS